MAHLLTSDLASAQVFYIPIRANMLPYLQGAIEALEDDSLWEDEASYEAAYNAIAEMRIAMAALGNANANYVLAGPTTGAAAPAAYRRLLAIDLPTIAYSALSGIPATFAPTAHAATHASAGADAITPTAIGAATSGHAHAYGALSGIPTTFNPIAHAFRHLTNGVDPITPAGIGAADVGHVHTTEVWTSPTLLNNWVNYGSGYNNAAFYKDASGRVFLRGLIKNGFSTVGTVIAQLPAGYRPPAQCLFLVPTYVSALTIGRIDVDTAGNIVIQGGGNVFLSLDGISFRTT